MGLIIGGRLARIGRFRLHVLCQSGIVLLNLAVIALTMSSSFRVHVLPAIPEKLARAYYGLGATHAALGSVTEGAALYKNGSGSPSAKYGCEAYSCSGGSYCCRVSRPTYVGTFHTCSADEAAEAPPLANAPAMGRFDGIVLSQSAVARVSLYERTRSQERE